MTYAVMIFIVALGIPCKSSALNKRQSPDDKLLTMFRKQEILLQQVQKQVNDKISALDSKITNRVNNLERALVSHENGAKKQDILLQQVEKQVHDSINELDSKITMIRDKLCPRGFYLNDFGCYKFIYDERLPYDNAATLCHQYQSHLVELQSEEEYEALTSLMDQRGAKHTVYHLGGKKVNDKWTWSESKKPFTFTNWYPGEDVIECARFWYSPGHTNHKKWYDNDCTYTAYSICEI